MKMDEDVDVDHLQVLEVSIFAGPRILNYSHFKKVPATY